MHPDDAYELAKSIHFTHYGEWILVVDGNLYVTCSDCGNATHYMHRRKGTSDEVRLDAEPQLTETTREEHEAQFPLYAEVKRLREQNRKLTHSLQTLKSCISIDGERVLVKAPYIWSVINMALGDKV